MANIIFVADKKTVKMMMLTLMTTTKCWVQMMILRYARYQENCAPCERAAVHVLSWYSTLAVRTFMIIVQWDSESFMKTTRIILIKTKWHFNQSSRLIQETRNCDVSIIVWLVEFKYLSIHDKCWVGLKWMSDTSQDSASRSE